ncbi:ABC transporter permease, partial [Actinomadura adrarensis]
AMRDYWDRVRAGDLGAMPAILGLSGLVILFTALRPETFLSERNIANLFVQALPITILAMGLVFVLLLGEIDLSAGVASGVCAAVMAKLIVDAGQPWYVAVLSAVATGIVIGAAIGWLVSVIRIPSFVVTLALFLGLQGITLWLIGQGGTVPVRDDVIVALANRNMPVWLGWVMAVVVAGGYAFVQLWRWRQQS